ncbi:MAG: adenosylcobinamide amidohydrolase [Dehalogenimonas sp.]
MAITGRRALSTFPGGSAEILTHKAWDTEANTLVINFEGSRLSLSGENGYRRVKLVCNSYMPKSLCDHLHFGGLSYDKYLRDLTLEIGQLYSVSPKHISFLSTGVTMEDVVESYSCFEDIWVKTWVTAGFKHNAMRIGVDKSLGVEKNGHYKECGTINIIVATNAKLSLATMASSFITITEAKGVALQDLRIHSSLNPKLQATGTGTDQIMVVSGDEFRCRYVGGHTKLGELMAKTVISACTTACQKQLAKDSNYHLVKNSEASP